jgi:hypothetical protein
MSSGSHHAFEWAIVEILSHLTAFLNPRGSNMSENQVPLHAASLFQKAHGRIVMLQRIDTQIASLLTQRRKVHEELGDTRAEIAQELDRVMHESDEMPAAVLGEISGTRERNGNGNGDSIADHFSRADLVGPQA